MMFGLQLWCFVAGLGCSFTRDVASDCVTREEFESRLLELTASHKRDIEETTEVHQREIRKLQEANEALEKRVETLEMLNHQNNKAVVGNEDKTTLINPTGDEPDNLSVSDNLKNSYTERNKTIETNYGLVTSDKTSAGIKTAYSVRKLRRRQENKNIVNTRFVLDEVAGRPVAFSVLLVGDLTTLGANQVIKFDKIVTNTDFVFDKRLGAFTAPISGYYAFSLAVMMRPNATQFIYVMRNGLKVFHVLIEGDFYNTATKTMVVRVEKGQLVWVQTSENADLSNNVRGSEHTSFTGFLLYANSS